MKILIGYDGSISSDAAIEDLRRAGLPADAEARVVCVFDHVLPHIHLADKPGTDPVWVSHLSEAEALAELAVQRLEAYFPRWELTAEALWGSPAKVLLYTAEAWQPDLIVVGSHGRSAVARLFLGSTSLELMHKASCSVRVVRSGLCVNGPVRLVIGNDGSTEAEEVVQSVASRFWPPQTEVHVVAAVQTLVPIPTGLEVSTFQSEPAFDVVQQADEKEATRLHEVCERSADTLRRAGLIPAFSVIEGIPGEILVQEAERQHADAIFVGACRHGRLDHVLLGSVSTHVATHAHCAVEVVRHRA